LLTASTRPSPAAFDVTIPIDRAADSIKWRSHPSRHLRFNEQHIMAKRKPSPPPAASRSNTVQGDAMDRSPATGATSSTSEEILAVANDTAERSRYQPTHQEIEQAAYQRYLDRGAQHGQDTDDWLTAERELSERRER
jgi:hypothetical protein